MKRLRFYDVKTKTFFNSQNYTIRKTKNNRKMAVAKSPSGITATRFVPMDFKK